MGGRSLITILAFGRFGGSSLVPPGRLGKLLTVAQKIIFEGDSKTTNPVVAKKG
jgi:hypothetical protein